MNFRLAVLPILATLPLFTAALTSPLDAQQTEVPPIVTQGLEALRTKGVAAALNIWLAGWNAEEAATARSQLQPVFTRFARGAGRMAGHDFAGTAHWGARTRRIYAVLIYENQPVYARFTVYNTRGGWKVTSLNVNTDVAEIFPPGMFEPGYRAR